MIVWRVMILKAKTLDNFWVDMNLNIKFSILDEGVEAGYLKKEFIEEMKKLEVKEDQMKRIKGRR